MTKKQKLIQEYITLAKEYHKNDIDFSKESIYQEDYLAGKKIAELESLIDYMRNTIEKRELKQKIDAFYATEEGAKMKEFLTTSIEKTQEEYLNEVEKTEKLLKEKIVEECGNDWTLVVHHGSCRASIEIGLKNDDAKRPNSTFKFGHEFTIYITKRWENIDKYDTEMSYGTLGSFNLESDTKRIEYLTGMAKVASDKEFISNLITVVVEMIEKCEKIGQTMITLKEKLQNPID